MHRALACLMALGVMTVGATTANADSPIGTVPACADIDAGSGTYDVSTGKLHMEVRLAAEPCSGEAVSNDDGTTTTTSATYALYVIRDKTWAGDPANANDLMNIFNVTGPFDQIELVTDEYSTDPSLVTQITDPAAPVITYDAVIPDDDPTVCVFSLVSGSTVTTREVEVPNQPVDENGNGNTADDTHRGNGGETNKDKGKFDWGTSTQTEEVERVDFFDRAPNEEAGSDPLSSIKCLAIDTVSTVIQTVKDATGEGRSYN